MSSTVMLAKKKNKQGKYGTIAEWGWWFSDGGHKEGWDTDKVLTDKISQLFVLRIGFSGG